MSASLDILQVPLYILARSQATPLRVVRRCDDLPRGGRFATGLIGIDEHDQFVGLAVYTETDAEMRLPEWPTAREPLELDPLLPAAVDFEVLYIGKDTRRVFGVINAMLRREAGADPLDPDHFERAWRTFDGARAAEAYHRATRPPNAA